MLSELPSTQAKLPNEKAAQPADDLKGAAIEPQRRPTRYRKRLQGKSRIR
jgi:hypothetical protein